MKLKLISPKENFITQIADLLPGVDKDYFTVLGLYSRTSVPAYYLRKTPGMPGTIQLYPAAD